MKTKGISRPRIRRKKGSPATAQSDPASTKQRIACRADLANRSESEGAAFDAAIVQRLREELWSRISDEFDEEAVRHLLPLLLAARRQILAERKQAAEGSLDAFDDQAREFIEELFGKAGIGVVERARKKAAASTQPGA